MTVTFAACARKSAALARASRSLTGVVENTTQWTEHPARSASSRRSVPPHPISMSSQWAPKAQDAQGGPRSAAEGHGQHQSTVASGMGTMKRAPQPRAGASCAKISSLKFQGRMKM